MHYWDIGILGDIKVQCLHTTSDNTAVFDKVHRLMSPRDSQCLALVWARLAGFSYIKEAFGQC